MRMTCLVSIQMERSCSLATVDCQNMCSRIHGDSSLMENLSRVVRASTNVIRSLVRLIFPFCCVSTLESILEAKWNIEVRIFFLQIWCWHVLFDGYSESCWCYVLLLIAFGRPICWLSLWTYFFTTYMEKILEASSALILYLEMSLSPLAGWKDSRIIKQNSFFFFFFFLEENHSCCSFLS